MTNIKLKDRRSEMCCLLAYHFVLGAYVTFRHNVMPSASGYTKRRTDNCTLGSERTYDAERVFFKVRVNTRNEG